MCIELFLKLNIDIQKEFYPLNWVDITNYEDNTGSVSFSDCGESSDVFFKKMEDIEKFIVEQGYGTSLQKFEADKDCPYDEATITIDFGGNKMKNLVTDAIGFFKMIGAANELAERGFDNQDIMTVEYCDGIVELCKKYGIECDDTLPDGILNAEDLLHDFFKSKLDEAVTGGDLE